MKKIILIIAFTISLLGSDGIVHIKTENIKYDEEGFVLEPEKYILSRDFKIKYCLSDKGGLICTTDNQGNILIKDIKRFSEYFLIKYNEMF